MLYFLCTNVGHWVTCCSSTACLCKRKNNTKKSKFVEVTTWNIPKHGFNNVKMQTLKVNQEQNNPKLSITELFFVILHQLSSWLYLLMYYTKEIVALCHCFILKHTQDKHHLGWHCDTWSFFISWTKQEMTKPGSRWQMKDRWKDHLNKYGATNGSETVQIQC